MNKFMKIALEEAESGIKNNEGGPFGCVIVKNGIIVGRGHNQVVMRKDPTCHGEVMAIRDACKNLDTFDLSECELYTTGEPCPMCFGAILWSNIAKVYYGCNIEDTEIIGFRDKRFYEDSEHLKKQLFIETDRSECLELYKKYNETREKTNY
ncbi:MAG: nucleoside deaminase [Ruminococcus sp.]|nr:nucleoside deaminase [Ruminococcus sp.]